MTTDENDKKNNLFDPKYEFDAPKFYDFEATPSHDSIDDRWFESRNLSVLNDVLFDFSDENNSRNNTILNIATTTTVVLSDITNNQNQSQNSQQANRKKWSVSKLGSATVITVDDGCTSGSGDENTVVADKPPKPVVTAVRRRSRSVDRVNLANSKSSQNANDARKNGPAPLMRQLTVPVEPNLSTSHRSFRPRAGSFRSGSLTRSNNSVSSNDSSKALAAHFTHIRPVVIKNGDGADSAGQHPIIAASTSSSVSGESSSTTLQSHDDDQNKIKTVCPLKATVVKPFNFQTREDEFLEKRRRAYEEYLKKEQEKIKPQTSYKNEELSKAPRHHCTISKPFHFLTDDIHARNEEKFKEKQKLDEENRKKATEFHAKQATVLKHAPFVPILNQHQHAAPKQTVKPLETEKRAVDRRKYDEYLKQREIEKERILLERKLALEKQEDEIIKQLRRRAEHKAQPVKHYKDVEPRSEPYRTIPDSPRFLTDERLEKRHFKRNNTVN